MADFTLAIEKITGSPSAGSACAVFNRRITLADLSVGTIVGCVLAKAVGDDVQIIIRDLFSLVAEKLEGLEGGVLSGLVHIRELSGELLGDRKISIDFAYAFFWQGAAYIVRRGQKVGVQIFDPPKSAEIKFSEGSGPVAGGQIYVIATEKFFSLFDTSVFSQEAEIEFGEIIDGLATEISAEADQSEIGAVFVQVKGTGAGEGEGPAVLAQDVEQEKTEEKEEEESRQEARERGEDLTAREAVRLGEVREKSLVARIWEGLVRELRKLAAHDMGALGRLRRNIVLLALVVLVILVGSISYAVYRNQQNKKINEQNLHLAVASTKLSEGTAIISLNRTRAREIFIEADREVDLALGIDGNSGKAKSLKEEIANKLKETEQTSNISFGTLVEASEGLVSLSFSGKNLITLGDDSIFEISTDDKSKEEIAGHDGVRAAEVYDSKVFLLTDSRVFRVDIASEKSDELFGHSGAQDIGVFLGNIYLLSGNKIDKYIPVEAGYSGPSDYLSSAEQFRENSKFAIDGLVWVTSGSKIFKYNRGEKQEFELSGVPEGVGELGGIYTDFKLDNLYVIDLTNSALLVIDRDGTYRRSYQSPEFSRASDLVVTLDEKKVYITSGTKVLEANLESNSANTTAD